MAQPESRPDPGAGPGGAARGRKPPAYAWAWLQRSRPVLVEVARRLTGGPVGAGFVQELRRRYEQDPFVRAVVVSVIADVAFAGRMPPRKPPGASWDRGLVWWAATIAGQSPAEFEATGAVPPATQRPLFDLGQASHDDDGAQGGGFRGGSPRRAAGVGRGTGRGAGAAAGPSGDYAALVRALRDLLATADGDQVPASALRGLLAQFDEPSRGR